jgi:hypothetical protein
MYQAAFWFSSLVSTETIEALILIPSHLLHHVIDMHQYIKRKAGMHIKSPLCGIQ